MTLWDKLVIDEGKREEIYYDHRGFPTIGVGYNLTNSDVLKLVLKQFGYTETSLGDVYFEALFKKVHDVFGKDDWQTNADTHKKSVQDTLNLYRELITDPALKNAASETFAFRDLNANGVEDEIKPVFDTALKDYVNQTVNEIAKEAKISAGDAKILWDGLSGNKRDTILSLVFNGGASAMIGEN